jgi:hypothetical protein
MPKCLQTHRLGSLEGKLEAFEARNVVFLKKRPAL